jgi:Cytochrome oxidase assembly protein
VIGAALGTARNDARRDPTDWLAVFAASAAATTLLLLVAGGLVTSEDAGLAVPDWPNSYGFNMFLFPLSRMTDSVFLEHAHRLFGALTGFTVLVMALVFQFGRASRQLKAAAWIALVLVVIQGVLGGIRVTEKSALLAMAHGMLGQLFFAYLVAIATLTSPMYARLCNVAIPYGARGDAKFSRTVIGVLIVQLLLGTMVRHFHSMHAFWPHLALALVAAALIVSLAVRSWGIYGMVAEGKAIRRSGLGLLHLLGMQLILGFVAWIVGVITAQPEQATAAQVWFATAHQGVGAVLLAWTVRLAIMHNRPAALADG